MSVAYPIPRDTRQRIVLASALQTQFGPFDNFDLFDLSDVQVWLKVPPAAIYTLLDASAYTVTPTGSPATLPGPFKIVLDAGVALNTSVWIKGARLQQRLLDVTAGGSVNSEDLESELDRESVVLQELRRDMDALVGGNLPSGALASGVGNDSAAPGGTVKDALSNLDSRETATEGVLTDLTDRVTVIEGEIAVVETRDDIETLFVAAAINFLRTAGFAVVGDGGAALYKRVSSEPAHNGKVQSAEGSWWELAEDFPSAAMFGGSATDLAAYEVQRVGAIATPHLTVFAADRTALAALALQRQTIAYLRETGRSGFFSWSSDDNSANVTNDPQQGIYVAPSTDATGFSGAWVRARASTSFFDITWFGAVESPVASNGTVTAHVIDAALQAAVALAQFLRPMPLASKNAVEAISIYIPAGYWTYLTLTTVTDPGIEIVGAGRNATEIDGQASLAGFVSFTPSALNIALGFSNSNNGVRDLHLRRNGNAVYDANNIAISFTMCAHSSAKNLRIENFSRYIRLIASGSPFWVSEVEFWQNSNDASFAANTRHLSLLPQAVGATNGGKDPVTASVTGSVSGTTLTVTDVGSGTILVGHAVRGTGGGNGGIAAGTLILSQLTGIAGSTGTYLLNIASTAASQTITTGFEYLWNEMVYVVNCHWRNAANRTYANIYVEGCDGLYVNGGHPGQGLYGLVVNPLSAATPCVNMKVYGAFFDAASDTVRSVYIPPPSYSGGQGTISLALDNCKFAGVSGSSIRAESTDILEIMVRGCEFYKASGGQYIHLLGGYSEAEIINSRFVAGASGAGTGPTVAAIYIEASTAGYDSNSGFFSSTRIKNNVFYHDNTTLAAHPLPPQWIKIDGNGANTFTVVASNNDYKTPVGTDLTNGFIFDNTSGGGLTLIDDNNRRLDGTGVSKIAGLTVTKTTGVLTVALGKTLTLSNTMTLAGTDGASLNIGAGFALDLDGTLAANSDAMVASQKATKTYVDALADSINAFQYKGAIDCSGNPNYPAANAGHTYVVGVAGKIGGASGAAVEAGDLLLCKVDGTAAGTQAAVGSAWNIIQVNIDGAVVGPASSTDTAVALFDGTNGKLIKNSSTTIDTDGTLAANSDTRLPSQKAVKTYADTKQAGNANLTAFAGLTFAANKIAYGTGAAALAVTDFTAAGISMVGAANAAAQSALLNSSIAPVFANNTSKPTTLSGYGITDAAALAGGQNLTGGFTCTSLDQGTKSSGTFTPAMFTGGVQHCVNGGAFTLAPPTGHGSMFLDITNNALAGAITTSGFTAVDGDPFDTTNTHAFRCFITVGNLGSHLSVKRMV